MACNTLALFSRCATQSTLLPLPLNQPVRAPASIPASIASPALGNISEPLRFVQAILPINPEVPVFARGKGRHQIGQTVQTVHHILKTDLLGQLFSGFIGYDFELRSHYYKVNPWETGKDWVPR